MDGNAALMELNTGVKVDYTNRIRLYCIGGKRDKYDCRIAFYELRPKQDEFIWIEAMPGDSCLRANADSGKMRRDKFDETCQAIIDDPRMEVRKTYG